MEFKVTETEKGFTIEYKNGEKAEVSFSSIFKKAGRNEDGSLPKSVLDGAVISICQDAEGKPNGVRVQALGEDFAISLHDAENGKDNFTYDEAMQWLKDHGKETFSRKQACIICIYIDDINDKLEEAGGESFAADWYTTNELYVPRDKRSCADYNAFSSWCFSGTYGVLFIYSRYTTYFRCRPSLASPFSN